MRVNLVSFTGRPLATIEEAACNCYDSKPTEDFKIMKSCYKSGHHSVLEFATFVFHVEGCSRALLAQVTRHRHCSFAVRSQRYCNEDGFSVVTPSSIKNNENALSIYNDTLVNIRNCYKKLQEAGIPNEDARFILPNACETQFEISLNLRELIHLANERLCTRSQWEIRKMVQLMVDEVVRLYPELKYMLVPKCEKYPDFFFCPEHKSCGRHKTIKELKKNIDG